MKWYSGIPIIALMIGVLLMVSTPDAEARFIVTLDDTATVGVDVIVIDDVDGGVGDATSKGLATHADGLAGDGVVNYSGPAGVFIVNVTTGVSKPVLGGPQEAHMDLNSVNVSGGAGTLKIELTDTDFSLPPIGVPYVMTSGIGGTTTGIVDPFDQFLDLTNAEFGSAGLTLSLGPFGPGPFSGSTSGGIIIPGLFSITEEVTITHGGAGDITSFDAESRVAIPEPGTLILLGSGLVGLAGYGKLRFGRKRKK